jgi:hypothetical protein
MLHFVRFLGDARFQPTKPHGTSPFKSSLMPNTAHGVRSGIDHLHINGFTHIGALSTVIALAKRW